MFSFVDQITQIEDGSIRGRFAVPDHFGGAPDWLMVEAIGQLAGWFAMCGSDFSKRPVAATVGRIDFSEPRRPRGVLDLSATIERTDRRAVLYRGAVACEGVEVVKLARCIGPLLPMEMFDDPQHVRSRFEALRGGSPVELWSSRDTIPAASVSDLSMGEDGRGSAHFRVGEDAALFSDHFPRHAVVPATILIEAMCGVGAATVGRVLGRESVLFTRVNQVKVRRFTEPGQSLAIEARPVDLAAAEPEVKVAASSDGEQVATVGAICSL